MKVLIVANYNPGRFSPFVLEQVESLRRTGIEFSFFGIVGKGPLGYLKNRPALIRKIKEWKPDIIHAHYGLSGLLATLQSKVPVVVTFHGSDIHEGGLNLLLSRIAARGASANIFVADHLRRKANIARNSHVIPCGADEKVFHPIDKAAAREYLRWSRDEKIVVFAGAFSRAVKNPELAKSVVAQIPDVRLVELSGYSREEVNMVFNAGDVLLMTSFNEGSPQVVKEAMLADMPILTVPVGDVAEVTGGLDNCVVGSYDAAALAVGLQSILNYPQRTEGRRRILDLGLTVDMVAQRIRAVYQTVLNRG